MRVRLCEDKEVKEKEVKEKGEEESSILILNPLQLISQFFLHKRNFTVLLARLKSDP